MGTKIDVSPSGTARKVKELYVGVNGTARRVKRAWVGVNGYARLCYVNEKTYITLYGGRGDTIKFTYNGTTYSYTTNSSSYVSVELNLTEPSASIYFYSSVTDYSRTATIYAGQSNSVYVRPTNCALWYGYMYSSPSGSGDLTSYGLDGQLYNFGIDKTVMGTGTLTASGTLTFYLPYSNGSLQYVGGASGTGATSASLSTSKSGSYAYFTLNGRRSQGGSGAGARVYCSGYLYAVYAE